jgi:type II secretory pathway component GspD/PulD (secretin)
LAERSDVQPDAFGPTKNITEGATSVLLLNGEETVLAGLLSHEKQNLRRGIPILKDLPLIRYVFGYNSSVHRKKELIILLEAKIVPSLMVRKNMTPMDLNKYLEKQRQEFKKLQQESRGQSDSRRVPARGANRTSQGRP